MRSDPPDPAAIRLVVGATIAFWCLILYLWL